MQNIKFEVIKKLTETKFKVRELKPLSRVDTISPPSVFIGSKLKYPMVNVGILSPVHKDENAWVYDDAKFWADNNFEITDVVKLRDSLLNSRFKSKVQDARLNKKFVEIAKEVAIASKPVDLEIELRNKPNFDRAKDQVLTPHGFRARLKQAKITSNVKVHQKVDKVIHDEIKASEAIKYLYKSDFNEYTLTKILSVGVMGLSKNKKLVPTRWSITATDDTIGKQLLTKIRDYKEIENHELFFGEFMGNQYMILLFPEIFSYELFELYFPGSSWNPTQILKASTDYEDFKGRKQYAFSTAGGYYASRLPILEYLDSIKRQASILVIRLETPTYWAALGVWVVRESVRKALNKKALKFNSKEELLNSTKQISKTKYNFEPNQILKQSKLLRQNREQKKLRDWF
ncbi:hypothetical protein ACFL0X_01275 [Nanoarchaeota archaeon]